MAPFDPVLRRLVEGVAADSPVVYTLRHRRPNRIVEVTDEGVRIETEKSTGEGKGPQLVPAWMIETAWSHLRATGSLRNSYLLRDLNVKRSSAVCALLAHLPGVTVASEQPVELHYRADE